MRGCYSEGIKALLEPMGIFDLNESSFGGCELWVECQQLESCKDELDKLLKESALPTAESYGLEMYEQLLPWRPVAETLQQRRQALAALLRISRADISLQAITGALAGCGVEAQVTETGLPATVTVSFPGVRGIPDNIEQLQQRIEDILPCHLQVEYYYIFTTWNGFEQLGYTWDGLEADMITWDMMQKLC